MRTAVLIAALLLGCLQKAGADTYLTPSDYRITCIDLATGKPIWESAPGPLSPPSLQLVEGKLLVRSAPEYRPASNAIPAQSQRRPEGVYLLDPLTGRELPWSAGLLKAPVQAEQPEPRVQLTDSSGRTFQYDSGNTHDLVVGGPAKAVTVLHLESYVHDLNVVGNLAVFSFASENGCCGGEVYAYDLARKQLAWEFDASQSLPELHEKNFTAVAVIDKRVYVSVDQNLFALELATGKKLWMTQLPRQQLRRYDSAWTKLVLFNNRLVLRVYEDLFLLDGDDGHLLWSFDAGPFGKPWPLIADNKLYLATRKGPVAQLSTTIRPATGAKTTSALKVSKQDASFTIELMSRRDIPSTEPIWWSLKRPTPSKSRGSQILLTLQDAQEKQITLDLSEPLSIRKVAYVKFAHWYKRAVLSIDGRIVASKEW